MPIYQVTIHATKKDVPQNGDWSEATFLVEASNSESAKPLGVEKSRLPDSELALKEGFSKHYAVSSHEFI